MMNIFLRVKVALAICMVAAFFILPSVGSAEEGNTQLLKIKELLRAGSVQEGDNLIRTMGDDETKKEATEQRDKWLAQGAVEFAKSPTKGDYDKSVKMTNEIKDENLKQKTLVQVGEADAKKFWSNWGAGFVVCFDMGNHKPVKSASIINNVVRVEEEDDVKYGMALEVHQFITGVTFGEASRQPWSSSIAVGPFVSVLPTTNSVIDIIGAGIIVGFFSGRGSEADTSNFSLNLGIGGYVDPGTRILADDFKDGQAPPEGETSIRYKTVAQYGVQAVLSFNYNF